MKNGFRTNQTLDLSRVRRNGLVVASINSSTGISETRYWLITETQFIELPPEV